MISLFKKQMSFIGKYVGSLSNHFKRTLSLSSLFSLFSFVRALEQYCPAGDLRDQTDYYSDSSRNSSYKLILNGCGFALDYISQKVIECGAIPITDQAINYTYITDLANPCYSSGSLWRSESSLIEKIFEDCIAIITNDSCISSKEIEVVLITLGNLLSAAALCCIGVGIYQKCKGNREPENAALLRQPATAMSDSTIQLNLRC